MTEEDERAREYCLTLERREQAEEARLRALQGSDARYQALYDKTRPLMRGDEGDTSNG